jgi:glycerol-3-phosphate dehydrogenase
MLLDKLEGSRVGHTIFQVPSKEGKGILVSPTVHGNLLVGPTAVQVAEDENTETTPEGLAIVARLAAKSVPSVNYRQVITSFTGVRASTASGDFILQASEKVPGLIHAGAIDSPGLTCCVSIAKYLVEILQSQGLTLTEKNDWNGIRKDPNAFQKMTDEEKDAFIKANPAYGKIVCRCEGITEGEILEAIRTNPKATDLDGVKRRTRGQMGRCQGGFCSPQIAELLAREQGVSLKQVTKFGGNSKINLQRTKGGAER